MTKKVEVILVGMDTKMAAEVQKKLENMGLTELAVKATEPAEDCTCKPCTLRREAEAEGRLPTIHPSLKVVDGLVRDKVRHRLFTDTMGNVIFFDQLFHPVDVFNEYTLAVEEQALEDFPLIREETPRYEEFDHTYEVQLTCLRGTLMSHDGRKAQITMIAGPTFDQKVGFKLQRAH